MATSLRTPLAALIVAIAGVASPLPASAQQQLPSNWAGAGAAYNSFASPKVSGWASYATLISEKGMIYSFTTHEVTSSTRHPFTIQTSIRSGLATVVRRFGPVVILGFGDAGMAGAGSSVGGSFSGGGIAIIQLGKAGRTTLSVSVRNVKSNVGLGQSQQPIEFGVGRTF